MSVPRFCVLRMLCAVIMASICSSCAIFRDPLDTKGFVARKDLQVSSLTAQGLSYFNASRYIEAELRLRQALYIAPGNAALLLDLAKILEAQARYDEARKVFLIVLERDRESPPLLSALGQLELKAGNFSESRRWFNETEQNLKPSYDTIGFVQLLRNRAVGEFLATNEEEALCLSWRAAWWGGPPEQVVRHLKLLVGLGLFDAADRYVERIEIDFPGIKESALYNHFKAMIAYERGKFAEVLNLEDRTLDRATPEDALESDITMIRYLALRRLFGERLEEVNTDPEAEVPEPDFGPQLEEIPMEPELPDRAKGVAEELSRRSAASFLFWTPSILTDLAIYEAEVLDVPVED